MNYILCVTYWNVVCSFLQFFVDVKPTSDMASGRAPSMVERPEMVYKGRAESDTIFGASFQ